MVTKPSFSTGGHGSAFGLPINTAIARMEATAEALRESAEKAPSRSESHGEKLKAAVKRKLHPRFAASAQPRAEGDESPGERLRKAVKQHPKSKENAQKNADKDRARYKGPPKPRPHTKSD